MMKINKYIWNEVDADTKAKVMARVQSNFEDVEPIAREIVEAVRDRGDKAIVELTKKIDNITLDVNSILVTEQEFDDAEKLVSDELRQAMQDAHDNIASHHKDQMPPPSWMKENTPGVIAGEKVTPIASVGLYVPRGKGSFPSVMLMLCTPAVISGVKNISVCTPPGPDGKIDAASLVAARICGIKTIYKVGGASAIAGFAYGTETISKVEKIVGPGNQYVSAAKRIVYGIVDPGTPAGPSESIILADSSADPEIVAREWMVEAEHGPDSAALLVTNSIELVQKVENIIPALVQALPEQRRNFVKTVFSGYGGIVITETFEESIDFVNEWAPEHLRVIASEPLRFLPQIVHAGEILLGDYACIPFGNFSIGLNAILPTGGGARRDSCVNVETFLKRSSFAFVSAQGAVNIGPIAVTMAQWEGFPAHENSAQYVIDKALEEIKNS